MKTTRRTALLSTLLPAAPAWLHAQAPAPRVLASFSILADMARELVPEGFVVDSLVGADADAHVFEPTPADVKRVGQADLVIVNGLGFEGWLDRLVKVSGYRGTVVVASQGVAVRRGADDGHGHAHGADPHAWHDLTLARRYVDNIAQALSQRWPAHAQAVAARRRDYLSRIERLHAWAQAQFDAVPRAQRRVLTSHDAFGYLGAAYGIEFLAPQGWATHSEPSAAAVARLIRQVRQQQVRAVFIENISDARLIERIARESGARVGGTLYSDALSRPGGPAGTYLRLMEHNVRSVAGALAPA
jgi:zinc/manganese transport system substrate-binding protein